MKYAISKGIKIFYQIRGVGDPLVLIMGFGADGNTWEKHVLEYEKHFCCLLIDNRGIGLSGQPEGPYTTSMMADDVIAVMNQENIKKARVAGISMGGAITQQLAINYPERVQSIALISTWAKFNNFAKSMYSNLKSLRLTSDPGVFMGLLQLWIFAPPYFETNLLDLEEGKIGARNNSNPQTQNGFEGQLNACVQHDVIDQLHKINVPTLITVGDLDIMTPPSFSKLLHHGIKNSLFVNFPNGGHVHHWEDLERFNQITTEFFLNN